jgi:hypothetical protein
VRGVDAREPVARVLVLPLRPHLRRLVGISGVGPDEVEPAPRPRPVRHRDLDDVAALLRPDVDPQRPPVVLERPRRAALAHRRDLELDGIERQPAQRRRDHPRPHRGLALDPPFLRQHLHVDPVVLDVDRPIRRPPRLGSGQHELARHHVDGRTPSACRASRSVAITSWPDVIAPWV